MCVVFLFHLLNPDLVELFPPKDEVGRRDMESLFCEGRGNLFSGSYTRGGAQRPRQRSPRPSLPASLAAAALQTHGCRCLQPVGAWLAFSA